MTKPVQPSFVEDVNIWKRILATVMKKPTSAQIKSAKERSEKFKKVCADD